MSAVAQIQAILDRVAKGSQTSRDVWSGGTYDFWELADNSADETFENRLKGTSLTAIDADLLTGAKWSTPTLGQLFILLENYCKLDLGYAVSGSAPALAAYLAAVGGWRIPYEAAERLNDATGLRVPAFRVFAPGTLPVDEETDANSGMHLFGTLAAGGPTWTAGTETLSSRVGPSVIMCINQGATQTAGGTFRCTNFVASTYKDIALSLSGVAQYLQTRLGEEAVTGAITAGDTAIEVASTANFTAGEYVLIMEGSTMEVALVSSLATGPVRLVVPALLNSYTTSAVVIPMFSSATYLSGGSGSGNVNVYAMPDRAISL